MPAKADYAMIMLRIFGSAIAGIFSFLACTALVGTAGWSVLMSLGVAAAFGWAFWSWGRPKSQHQ
jgi:predicted membrane channel-forming protein YqfA (hemolysin III family)